MQLLLLYRVNSETERLARDFVGDFQRQTGKELAIVEADSVEGTDLMRLYDIVNLPAILARTDDGVLQQLWQGQPLPRVSEVSFYTAVQ